MTETDTEIYTPRAIPALENEGWEQIPKPPTEEFNRAARLNKKRQEKQSKEEEQPVDTKAVLDAIDSVPAEAPKPETTKKPQDKSLDVDVQALKKRIGLNANNFSIRIGPKTVYSEKDGLPKKNILTPENLRLINDALDDPTGLKGSIRLYHGTEKMLHIKEGVVIEDKLNLVKLKPQEVETELTTDKDLKPESQTESEQVHDIEAVPVTEESVNAQAPETGSTDQPGLDDRGKEERAIDGSLENLVSEYDALQDEIDRTTAGLIEQHSESVPEVAPAHFEYIETKADYAAMFNIKDASTPVEEEFQDWIVMSNTDITQVYKGLEATGLEAKQNALIPEIYALSNKDLDIPEAGVTPDFENINSERKYLILESARKQIESDASVEKLNLDPPLKESLQENDDLQDKDVDIAEQLETPTPDFSAKTELAPELDFPADATNHLSLTEAIQAMESKFTQMEAQIEDLSAQVERLQQTKAFSFANSKLNQWGQKFTEALKSGIESAKQAGSEKLNEIAQNSGDALKSGLESVKQAGVEKLKQTLYPDGVTPSIKRNNLKTAYKTASQSFKESEGLRRAQGIAAIALKDGHSSKDVASMLIQNDSSIRKLPNSERWAHDITQKAQASIKAIAPQQAPAKQLQA